MLQKDPNRQWFVYYKEKEFGPLAESQVQEKFQCGEFGEEAYVFSEGMDDWQLLKEINVFNEAKAQAPNRDNSPAQSVAQRSSITDTNSSVLSEAKIEPDMTQDVAPEESSLKEPALAPEVENEDLAIAASPATDAKPLPASSFDPTINVEKINEPLRENREVKEEAAVAREEAPPIQPRGPSKVLRLFLAMLLSLALVLAAWTFLKEPIRELLQEVFPSLAAEKSQVTEGSQGIVGEDSQLVEQQTAETSLWDELAKVKNPAATDEAPAFGVSSRVLDSERPVIVGALSTQYQVDEIKIAVYPDAEKSLLSFPRIWTGVVPVLDGYFTFGPLSFEGAELPPGLYHVVAYAASEYLGEIDLEVGTWPDDLQVLEYSNKRNQQMSLRRAGEQEEIANIFSEAVKLQQQLDVLKKIAFVGPKKYKQFLAKIEPWNEQFVPKIQEQYKRQFQPNFYPQSQALLYDYFVEILEYRDSLTLLSKGGRSLLFKQKKLQPGMIDKEVGAVQEKLKGEILVMKETEAVMPKVSVDDVKRYLEEL